MATLVLSAGSAAGALGTPARAAALPGDRELSGFDPVLPNLLDEVVVPDEYEHAVLIKWGDRVLSGAPEFDLDRQTPEAQLAQFGYNNDYVALLPLDGSPGRALLVVNHEYTDEQLMFRDFSTWSDLSIEQLKICMAAHGMSIVEIEQDGVSGRWSVTADGPRPYNRRITPLTSTFRMTGPAAGTDLLRVAADPAGRTVIGTINNCAGGVTPWGTTLSGEENFNYYFDGADAAPEALKPSLARYGFNTTTRYPSYSRKWGRVDPRFDLSLHPHEAHRFGWVVEVDPYAPRSTPRKHTALGRIKHEGATVVLSRDRRAVVYMGDDERFEYLYKFVSSRRMDSSGTERARRHNLTLLEEGTLYVAALAPTSAAEIDGSGSLPSDGAFNGRGRWIPLASGTTSLVPGMSIDEVLVFTRMVADAVGATKMDRPEDVEANPRTGKVYAALSNNSNRGASGGVPADEANPRNANRHGHVIEMAEDGDDNAAESFTWNVFLLCGDPADPSSYFGGFDKSQVSPISCPDNLTFDSAGNLWIATDSNALGSNDGLFVVPLQGAERGHVRQFLTVPIGAEATGPVIGRGDRTLFLSVAHPGEVDGATVDKPVSRWPDGGVGKPAVICVWRNDGRPVGT